MVFFTQNPGEQPKQLPPGYYLISRDKHGGPGTHYGLLEIGQYTNYVKDNVFEQQKLGGYRAIPFEEFQGGKHVTIHEGKPPAAAQEILERVRTVPGWKPAYDLLLNNCEHCARYVYSGKHESTQSNGLFVLGALAGLAIVFVAASANE